MAEVLSHSSTSTLTEEAPHTWHDYVTTPRAFLAGMLTVGLAAGGLWLSRSHPDASPSIPNGDRVVAAGSPTPGAANEIGSTPSSSTGGFNNAGHVVLKCIGLDIKLTRGTANKYDITPKVQVVSGDPTSPYLYTVLGTDLGHNIASQGVSTLSGISRAENTVFPVVVLVDTAGTPFGPNNPEALTRPLGDKVPDAQMFECPPVPYPRVG